MTERTSISFTKLSVSGNDFVFIDNRKFGLGEEDAAFFRRVCQRRTGVGSDGVLLIDEDPTHDFRLRYFNPDGSESGCGNGARAAAYQAFKIGLVGAKTRFVFNEQVFDAGIDGDEVRLRFPAPRDLQLCPNILSHSTLEEAGFVDTGVPHYVLYSADVSAVDVVTVGQFYRYHQFFQPAGTNVDFVQVEGRQTITVRTYERGVEDETLACGTGALAAAIFVEQQKEVVWPVRIRTKGGLSVASRQDGALYLSGRVEVVYEGVLASTT